MIHRNHLAGLLAIVLIGFLAFDQSHARAIGTALMLLMIARLVEFANSREKSRALDALRSLNLKLPWSKRQR